MPETVHIPSWRRALDNYKARMNENVRLADLAERYGTSIIQVTRDVDKIHDLLYSNALDWEWDYDNLEKLMELASKYVDERGVIRVVLVIIQYFHSPKELLNFDKDWHFMSGVGAKFKPAIEQMASDIEYRKTYLGG